MKEMGLSKFFAIYFLLGIFLVFWILFSKRKKPSRLNMRKGSERLPEMNIRKDEKTGKSYGKEKSLDCFFMYNGHEFNAYEVLGVPAGCQLTVAKQAYEELKSEADMSQHLFIRLAFEAIEYHLK